MVEKIGTVSHIGNRYALMCTDDYPEGGCAVCAESGSCLMGSKATLSNVKIPLYQGIQVGQRVHLVVDTTHQFLGLLMVFVLPVLAMMVAFLGAQSALTEGLSIGVAFTVALGTFLIAIWSYTRFLSKVEVRVLPK